MVKWAGRDSLANNLSPTGVSVMHMRLGAPITASFHHPEKSAERQAARRAGGSKHKVVVLLSSAPDARLLTLGMSSFFLPKRLIRSAGDK